MAALSQSPKTVALPRSNLQVSFVQISIAFHPSPPFTFFCNRQLPAKSMCKIIQYVVRFGCGHDSAPGRKRELCNPAHPEGNENRQNLGH